MNLERKHIRVAAVMLLVSVVALVWGMAGVSSKPVATRPSTPQLTGSGPEQEKLCSSRNLRHTPACEALIAQGRARDLAEYKAWCPRGAECQADGTILFPAPKSARPRISKAKALEIFTTKTDFGSKVSYAKGPPDIRLVLFSVKSRVDNRVLHPTTLAWAIVLHDVPFDKAGLPGGGPATCCGQPPREPLTRPIDLLSILDANTGEEIQALA